MSWDRRLELSSAVIMLSFSDVASIKVLAIRARNARGERRKLWSEAANSVGDLGIKQELVGSHFTIEGIQAAAQSKLDECIRKRWKYTRSDGQKVVLWDVLERVTRWINKFKEVGDVVIQYDPGHAALPWAAIRFILQASVGSVETFGSMLDGLELTSRIIAVYAEVERTCLRGVSKLKTQLANELVKLYAGVLTFLSKAVQYFGQSSSKRTLKGAFQSYQTSVAPYIERIKRAEEDVCRLISLVQSEGTSLLKYNAAATHVHQATRKSNLTYYNTNSLRSKEPPNHDETRNARLTTK